MPNENQNATIEEMPKALDSVKEDTPKAVESGAISIQPEDSGACQEEHTRCVMPADKKNWERKVKSQWL